MTRGDTLFMFGSAQVNFNAIRGLTGRLG